MFNNVMLRCPQTFTHISYGYFYSVSSYSFCLYSQRTFNKFYFPQNSHQIFPRQSFCNENHTSMLCLFYHVNPQTLSQSLHNLFFYFSVIEKPNLGSCLDYIFKHWDEGKAYLNAWIKTSPVGNYHSANHNEALKLEVLPHNN